MFIIFNLSCSGCEASLTALGPEYTMLFGTGTFGMNKKSLCVQKPGHKSPESQPEAGSVVRVRAKLPRCTRGGNTGLAKSPAKWHSVFKGRAWARPNGPAPNDIVCSGP